jgi:predicted anti-sigma-YlaC factor YlaD
VKESQIERLVQLVARTRDEELSCSACFDLLPQYVDIEVAGEAPDLQLPLFRRHLEQCSVCREEYETLRELARLEAEGRSPSIDDLRRTL